MDAYVGAIVMFAGNYAPDGWILLQGQTLKITDYPALFSLVGKIYGGDGVTTFGLPDLRGTVPIGFGAIGQAFAQSIGGENQALTAANLPAHSHTMGATMVAATTNSPTLAYPANTGNDKDYSTTGGGSMNTNFLSTEGGGAAHPNVQPYLAINFIMPLNGIYPNRN